MSLKLNIKQHLSVPSDRVKCIDLLCHPSAEPWMLCALHNGHVLIINYQTQQIVEDFEVCAKPVRCAKFIERKNWIVTGSDDGMIRIYDVKSLAPIHSFKGHSDFVRSIIVHPELPLLLTCSDDSLIKLWNWDKQWSCDQVFEGHSHYVMQIAFNPKDFNTFASASLDKTVKTWQLDSNVANLTLEGHKKGVNCVNYYHTPTESFLISGGDDYVVKIWNPKNNSCVQTLGGHSDNVTAVALHKELPIVFTGSEDGTFRIWRLDMEKQTHYLESCIDYGLKRLWTIANHFNNVDLALGFDEGSIIIKVQQE
ncbi:uncharacterized protein Dwil_GK12739 [Drosophila willistoni]|uniref:Beta'-coat protein n=1 Tax=Drosophila willistoni TaxID=7260 RepID=B4NKM6_DROWI|nr:coatomer subunit beta' [Drosophila willistoni]EDW85198.1 uncharacterized protein Dwil_GK12739 [Drosophila willistoni]